MLGCAGLGGQYGRIHGQRAERAVLTGWPLWVGMARAIAAQVARDRLHSLPVSRPQTAEDMAGRLERQARVSAAYLSVGHGRRPPPPAG